MAGWVELGPLTGIGYVPGDSAWTGYVRVWTVDVSTLQVMGQMGDPQNYAKIGWIAPYEDANGNPTWTGPHEKFLGPKLWLEFQYQDFDLTEFTTDIAGFSGIAYSLFPGIAIHVYQWTG